MRGSLNYLHRLGRKGSGKLLPVCIWHPGPPRTLAVGNFNKPLREQEEQQQQQQQQQ